MKAIEVQGIVSVLTGEPLVQFRLIESDVCNAQWQATVVDTRELGQKCVEAAMNAVYDAALVSFCREHFPGDDQVIAALLTAIRRHRADTYGLPDQPDDWRPQPRGEQDG
jgi:hypothetical protein